MAEVPDLLTLERHRDLAGRVRLPVVRWVLLGLLAALSLAGLAGAFGQRPETAVAESTVARLKVYAPTKLRGGLYFELRITIDALEEIEDATIVLSPEWMEGLTLNTVEPGPIGEASRDGKVAFRLGHIPKGDTFVTFLQYQVNPTNIGRRAAVVELDDGEQPLLRVERTLTIWP